MIWYVLAGILALLLLLLMVPLTLSVRINEQGKTLIRGRILGICVFRSPKKKKRVRPSRYTPRAIRRRERKALRAQTKPVEKGEGRAPKHKDVPLSEQISSVASLSSLILRRSLHHARVTVDALALTVATPDAAQSAILYGAAQGALALLTDVLHEFSHLRIRHPERFGIAVDFTGEKTRADIRLRFCLRVHHVIRIACHTLTAMVKREIKKQKNSL